MSNICIKITTLESYSFPMLSIKDIFVRVRKHTTFKV